MYTCPLRMAATSQKAGAEKRERGSQERKSSVLGLKFAFRNTGHLSILRRLALLPKERWVFCIAKRRWLLHLAS